MRANGEVSVQHEACNFRGSVQWSHFVSDSHTLVEPGLVGIRGEPSHAGFLGSNRQLLSLCPPHQERAQSDSPCFCVTGAGSRDKQRKVVSIGRHFNISDLAVRHKMCEEGWGND